jgi:hypothetical protein
VRVSYSSILKTESTMAYAWCLLDGIDVVEMVLTIDSVKTKISIRRN